MRLTNLIAFVVLSSLGNPALVAWGTGSVGTAFMSHTVLGGAAPATLAKVVDLDGDGFLDILLVQPATDGITTYRNTQSIAARPRRSQRTRGAARPAA